MFGIGFWEMLVIAGLVLVAVGPERLPGMLKQLAKVYRQFRRAADDIRNSTGIDQMLRDEELKELADLRKQRLDLLGTTGNKAPPKPVVSPVKPLPKPEASKVVDGGKVAEGGKPDVGTAKTAAEVPASKSPKIPPTASGQTADATPMGVPASSATLGQSKTVVRGVSEDDREREHPAMGVDLFEARRLEPPAPAPVEVPPEHVHPSKAEMFAKAKASAAKGTG